jgi:hypothetical protein
VADQSSQNCSGASLAFFFGARYSTSTRVGLNDIGLSIVLSTAKSQKAFSDARGRPSARIVT